ncbi:MAG TPA: hypothetical protein VI432_00305 [Candidatus Paceibacterota bacterium]
MNSLGDMVSIPCRIKGSHTEHSINIPNLKDENDGSERSVWIKWVKTKEANPPKPEPEPPKCKKCKKPMVWSVVFESDIKDTYGWVCGNEKCKNYKRPKF